MLGNNTVFVVGLFNLHKRQRHTVDQQNDIWSKLVITVTICQLRHNMIGITGTILKINQADTVNSVEQDIVKRLAKIFV